MAQARGLLDGIGWYEDHALVAAVEGVGHAILALAEQQQLANTIALAEHARQAVDNGRWVSREALPLLEYGETPDSTIRVRDEIAELLR